MTNPTPQKSDRPSDKIVERARPVMAGNVETPDGEPYLPSNGSEGSIFEDHWCRQCSKDSWLRDGQKSCGILMGAHAGKQPKEWKYWGGAPLCTKFKHFQERSQPKPTPINELPLFAMESNN